MMRVLKSAINLVLILSLLMTMLPSAAIASTRNGAVLASGSCGENVTWTLTEDGTLTISGQGEMILDSDFVSEWDEYQLNITKVVIEEGVTSIADSAFYGCTHLAEISIPDSVTVIDDWAFGECYSLKTIRIPDSVTCIGEYAFVYCTDLSLLILGEGITTIEDNAFYCNYSLWHVLYAGTAGQWEGIYIGEDNFYLMQTTKHYSCDGTEVTDLKNYVCQRCSCDHAFVAGAVTEPTCTEKGFTLYTCTHCNESLVNDYTPAKGHSYESEVTVEPTLEAPGVLTYTCIHCGHSYDDYIPRLEGECEQTPAISYNVNGYDYVNAFRWASPIYSYLTWENDGFIRVEAIGDVLTVERYDENLQFLSRRDIPLELPIFGGAYFCDDYNFVVVGQSNELEDDNVEVLRIIRYTKDWERVDAASLYGANTVWPFQAGSLRFARVDNKLLIRTCHKMYASSDGVNHQANMTVCVDIDQMEIIASEHLVAFGSFGYVSHSFNQFVLVDGEDVLMLDHGDAYPRALVLFRTKYADGYFPPQYLTRVYIYPIADSTDHYNDTGVAVGGLAYSDTHYLVAANSTSQAGGIDFHGYQRNIFIAATPKDDFSAEATQITWITDYDEGSDVELGTPQLTKLNDGRFFLMWAVDGKINCCFITADGKLDGNVFEAEGSLSDCLPIQHGDSLIWYVTCDSAPVFCSIDLNAPGTVTVPHTHTYASRVVVPTCGMEGQVIYTCTECDASYVSTIPPFDHRWGLWEINVMPTQTKEGTQSRLCTVCGKRENRTMPVIHELDQLESEHSYGDNMDQTWVYTDRDADGLLITFDPQTAFEDYYDYLQIYDLDDNLIGQFTGMELAGATITVPGHTVKLRLVSDVSQSAWGFKVTEIQRIHIHQWGSWQVGTEPTQIKEGELVRACLGCGEQETKLIPPVTALEDLQSNHPYNSSSNQTWTYCVPGADALLVSFDQQSDLEMGWDLLKIYDADGNLVGEYSGQELAGTTISVPGCMLTLHLISDEFYEYWGFRVTEVIPVFLEKHTHHYTAQVEADPTCENPGLRVYTCSECGDAYTEEIPATGHTEVTDAAVAPTCTQTGLAEGSHCGRCGEVLVAQAVVDALGHDERIDPAVSPTCTETGTTEGSHCDRCGQILVAQQTVDALGHDYELADSREPTCTEDGYHSYICKHDNRHSYTETVAATGHAYFEVTTEPTCTQDGYTTHICANCEDSFTDGYVAALGHSYVDGVCAHCGAPEAQLGDVNGDGRVNTRDARAILRYIAGQIEADDLDLAAADFNGDGRVNVRDARAILRQIAGLD